MITIPRIGRLGNAMFRNCAASILSKKFDIKVKQYLNEKELDALHPGFYKGGNKLYENNIQVNYQNFTKILDSKSINYGLNLTCPCQDKKFIYEYRKDISNLFNLKYVEQHMEDLFVHVRLGDCIKNNRVPSLYYYTQAIEKCSFKTGYISTDTPSHEIIGFLLKKFNLNLYKNTPANTINFGKNFGNIVLSRGTFSWWIGFLSKAEKIFYPRGGPKWHGDIFIFDEWSPINY